MLGGIVELGFQSSVRPELGFELMRYSQLAARRLSHPLGALSRLSFFMLLYGLKGRTRHRIDFEQCPLAPHHVAVVAPGRVQAFDPRPGLELWLLLFTPEFLALPGRDVDPLRGARLLSPFLRPPVLKVPSAGRGRVLALVEALEAEYARPPDPVQRALLSALLRALLLELERLALNAEARSSAPAELEAFQNELERRYAETRAVESYARALGVSPRTLNQLTRRHLGAGAKQTIDRRVVLELKRLLAFTDLSVKELAARFHFREPTNLVKFFRHHTAQTPLAFRDAAR